MAGPRPAAAAGGRAFGVVCAFERACAASALAGALALAAGMIVVLADILTRRLLATPLVGVNDLVQLAVVASACLAKPAWAEDLATTVANQLRDSGALSGYRVNVKSKSGTVWLEGRVADFVAHLEQPRAV